MQGHLCVCLLVKVSVSRAFVPRVGEAALREDWGHLHWLSRECLSLATVFIICLSTQKEPGTWIFDILSFLVVAVWDRSGLLEQRERETWGGGRSGILYNRGILTGVKITPLEVTHKGYIDVIRALQWLWHDAHHFFLNVQDQYMYHYIYLFIFRKVHFPWENSVFF